MAITNDTQLDPAYKDRLLLAASLEASPTFLSEALEQLLERGLDSLYESYVGSSGDWDLAEIRLGLKDTAPVLLEEGGCLIRMTADATLEVDYDLWGEYTERYEFDLALVFEGQTYDLGHYAYQDLELDDLPPLSQIEEGVLDKLLAALRQF